MSQLGTVPTASTIVRETVSAAAATAAHRTGPRTARPAGLAARQRRHSSASTRTPIAMPTTCIATPTASRASGEWWTSSRLLPHCGQPSATGSHSSVETRSPIRTVAYAAMTSAFLRPCSRPLGNAITACSATGRTRLSSSAATVIGSDESHHGSSIHHANPTAAMRGPIASSGCRAQATSPAPTQATPTNTWIAASAGGIAIGQAADTTTSATAMTMPSAATAIQARLISPAARRRTARTWG